VTSRIEACRRCARLADFLARIRVDYPSYHARPVAPFGDPEARLLIVGLAPGMHGANASGRPFTGDHAGILLYETLYHYGFSNHPESRAQGDGLELIDCRITNAVKCLPPQNKPLGCEIARCNDYLRRELQAMPAPSVMLALGAVAHRAVLKALGLKQRLFPFGHGTEHGLGDGLILLDSYHCSRYNTQTGRLNPEMFRAVFARARALLSTVPYAR
jgi:uracil-DNA glycosylase family 4